MSLESIIKKQSNNLALRNRYANKGTYGRLLIIGGSRGMAGAAYIAGLAAFRCGIGMVKYLGPEDNRIILQSLIPEAMYESDIKKLKDSLRWADYVIAGPGLSTDEYASSLVSRFFDDDIIRILQDKKLVVLDADALNIMARDSLDPGKLSAVGEAGGSAAQNIVITPHVMEMVRLAKADKDDITVEFIKKNPAVCASEYCQKHKVTVVLKDYVTTVAERDSLFGLDYGCGAMAKAGSGDALCGFIAGITAVTGGNAADAVPLAVYLHGRAGCIAAMEGGTHSLLARDIANAAPRAILETCRRA